MRKFRYMLQEHKFTVFTDLKPLIFAFKQKLEKCSSRQTRQLDFISQFTTYSQYIKGVDNIVADTLSCIHEIKINGPIDYMEIAQAQSRDDELKEILNANNSLQMKKVKLPNSEIEMYCDISTGIARPYIPKAFRKFCFNCVHNLVHPGIRTTSKIVHSRWTEAIPIIDIQATMVVEAFYANWIARFGVQLLQPIKDINSSLFKALTKLIGKQRIHTTAYHPQSNGLIEEFHHQLKAALMCHDTLKWTEVLPTVLLGLRTALKETISCMPAELVYGTTIKLQGDFFDKSNVAAAPVEYLEQLRSCMQQLNQNQQDHIQQKQCLALL
ncbi:hypothetical protein X975_27221, partial [Stegodyphus mimosarum]